MDGAGSDTSERDGCTVRSKPAGTAGGGASGGRRFDYMEVAQSASTVSTPPDEPFASDDLGETVIKLNKTVTHMKLARPLEGCLVDAATSPMIKADSAELVPGFGEMVCMGEFVH